jgi:hypothetical protein
LSLNQSTKLMMKYHDVQSVDVRNGMLIMIVDGISISKSLKDISSLLADATVAEQSEFEVSPSGYGIHLPLIDEDISIDALLGITHQREGRGRAASL